MIRRDFIKHAAGTIGSLSLAPLSVSAMKAAYKAPLFDISLAEWSLHVGIFSEKFDHLDFAISAKRDYGIEAVEYVNTLFAKGADKAYLKEMKTRADGEGVRSLLIMCSGLDPLSSSDQAARMKAVEGHYEWIEAARFLGCRAIRVNAQRAGTRGTDSPEAQSDNFVESMNTLGDFGADHGIQILLENHGGLSSDVNWVVETMKKVNHPNCGSLPDFGNSELGNGGVADPYELVAALMPFSKGHVSAKAETFGAGYSVGVDAFKDGERLMVDYKRMLKIVLDAGFQGYLGVEFQGKTVEEEREGIKRTKKLLERVREELASE